MIIDALLVEASDGDVMREVSCEPHISIVSQEWP